MKLTPQQMRVAKQKLAQSRGIGVESISDESVGLALDAGTVITWEQVCGDPASSGINSYDAPLGD
jgi:hypothetical protein